MGERDAAPEPYRATTAATWSAIPDTAVPRSSAFTATRRTPRSRWTCCAASPAIARSGLVSIQGLHRFYSRGGDVVASWMTKEDREQAIADNVDYVGKVLTTVADEFGITRPLIYVGFSQGVAMAFAPRRSCSAHVTA